MLGLDEKLYLRAILDAFPSPVFVVDENLIVHDANIAAKSMINFQGELNAKRLCGEILKCVNAKKTEHGCGGSLSCEDCVIRQTVLSIQEGKRTFRRTAEMLLEKEDFLEEIHLLVSGSPIEYEERKFTLVALEDITELVSLRRIVPICSYCRKVRDDKDYWQHVEEFLKKNTQLRFSHGICPDCMEMHFSENPPMENI